MTGYGSLSIFLDDVNVAVKLIPLKMHDTIKTHITVEHLQDKCALMVAHERGTKTSLFFSQTCADRTKQVLMVVVCFGDA